jgi:hypothetical protein
MKQLRSSKGGASSIGAKESREFWHCMFWFMVESAMVNSWVLYKSTQLKAGQQLLYDHQSFRMFIILALARSGKRWGATINSPWLFHHQSW